jgi:cbb3-type cytochrome oxidase maturation protein
MLYILIVLALLVLGVAIWALFWAIRNRQFDNLESQAWNVVLDDDRRPPGGDEGPSRENDL